MAKRKTGKRTNKGRLSRAGRAPNRITPNEHTQAMIAMFGENYSDSIGRAFASGLLGKGQDAKDLLDTARSLFRAYWQAYTTRPICSAIGDKTGGSTRAYTPEESEAIKRREKWLNECLECVRRMGVRREFDALVIDINPDHGPAWLDAIIWGDPTSGDRAKLRAALDALDAITNDRMTQAA